MDVRADPSRILGIGAIALALLAGAGRAAAQLGAFASVRPGLWLGLGSALVYLLAALCLAEPARRAGARAWWLVALLASMPLVPATAMALASPAAWVALAPLAPLWYFAPVSLGLAAWLAARARGERLRPLPLALAALYVAVDLAMLVAMRTTVPTGRETVYAFNVVGPLQPLLLVGFVLASAPAAWRRPGLPTGALALAIAGGLAASGSMLTLVALGGLRPFDGVESLAFAAFAFGLGLAQAGLGAAALAVSQASLPPRPANPEEGAAAST